MHKLHHGLTGGSRVRQIMTIHDGLGGGVTRLRYDIIYEQIHLKKTPENTFNVRMFFKLGTFDHSWYYWVMVVVGVLLESEVCFGWVGLCKFRSIPIHLLRHVIWWDGGGDSNYDYA